MNAHIQIYVQGLHTNIDSSFDNTSQLWETIKIDVKMDKLCYIHMLEYNSLIKRMN